jgi:hypothetical protein
MFNGLDPSGSPTNVPSSRPSTNAPPSINIGAVLSQISPARLTLIGVIVGVLLFLGMCTYCCLKQSKNKQKIHMMMNETQHKNDYEEMPDEEEEKA